jgi:hypothetical protein
VWRNRALFVVGALALVVLVLSVLSAAGAVTLPVIGGTSNSNDLAAIGQGLGQTPQRVPTAERAEPPLVATPLSRCGPGSHPEPGVDGRVPAGSGTNGLWCNIRLIAHQGSSGGFKVIRYIDQQGHVCAFYDTALLFPTNAFNSAGASLGVKVLDMSNPAHPVLTDTLNQAPMMTPHESLNLNVRRGLLAAVNGNPATEPGLVSIYDAHADCRHPVLDSTSLVARFGHESGFSPDGRTFYATATALPGITAIDVTNPKNPHSVWQGNVQSHGMTISDDGNRAYIADPFNGDMLILDTSQIQARRPNPQAREVSRLTWKSASIPQNAIPFTENRHPYVLEFDEYTAGTVNPAASKDTVGAARIIDVSNETRPFVVANLRLQVDQPAQHHAAENDPGTFDPAQGYAAHYCNIPSRVDPKIVACSFIASGLRIFDISNLFRPKEIAYFVSPTTPNFENGYQASDFAMSQPSFDVARHEIWYSDGGTGFYVVQVTNGMWPGSSHTGCPAPTGRLAGRSLGPIKLGMTRAHARQMLPRRSSGRRSVDVFCLSRGSIRAEYRRNRVALALTGNRHYALRGVRPGARLARVGRRIHLGTGLRTGRTTWYLIAAGRSRGVLEVRHRVVVGIGIAEKSATARRDQALRLFRSVF